MTTHLPDHYAVLGVAATASTKEIAHAYRARVRSEHPDVHHHTEHDRTDALREVIAAYWVLRDPARRADYDRQRQPTTNTGPPPTAAASPRSPQPPLRAGPVRYHGPLHRGHQ